MAYGATIPAVLKVGGNTAISTERALNQMKRLIEELPCSDETAASLDDIGVMLAAVDRG